MSPSLRLLLLVAIPVLGMARVACADLSKLLEPVGGATLGRPGASPERPEDLPGVPAGSRSARQGARGPVAQIIKKVAHVVADVVTG